MINIQTKLEDSVPKETTQEFDWEYPVDATMPQLGQQLRSFWGKHREREGQIRQFKGTDTTLQQAMRDAQEKPFRMCRKRQETPCNSGEY